MRRVLVIAGRVLTGLLVLVILLVSAAYVLAQRRLTRVWEVPTPSVAVSTDAGAVARGRRLATVIGICSECHGADFGGKAMLDGAMMGRLWAANLTRGRGGIGATYAPDDWGRVLLHGVKRDGRGVVFMPSNEFHFTAAEVGDLVAFFQSLPPVDRVRPPTRIGPLAAVLSYVSLPLFPAEDIDHATARFAEPVVATTAAAQGAVLTRKAVCAGCHKPDFTGGAGPPPGASNLTPVGIGRYSETDFVRAIRQHLRPNGTKIDDAMPVAFGNLSDEELHAMYTYLKTLPPKGKKRKRQM